MRSASRRTLACLLAIALVAGCGVQPLREGQPVAPLSPPPVTDRALQDRILALDPDHVTPADVANVLAKGPTPRIMLLHGGIYPVHLAMSAFGRFLVGMGYPEARIRDPFDGAWSHSPYEDAERLAGMLAFYYEKEGMVPIIIGHSQGGMQAVKILYVLAGDFADAVPVWNPLTDLPERRTTFVDPLTRREVPVVGGFKVPYVSVVGAGGAAFLLPNQWTMVGKLRTVPDTVEEFTGYAIDLDLWAWTLPGVKESRDFTNSGHVRIRNVVLPASNNHVFIPVTDDLLKSPAERAWVDNYQPDAKVPPPPGSPENIEWAADVWRMVKKYWVIEAQRLIRARRTVPAPAVAGTLE
ncbi:MAG TPA: hypothetical protein VF196_04855 [Casimicrobiaceae bacterium]